MPFARRTDWEQHPNALHCLLEDLKSRQKEVLDLTESNPTACGFTYPPALLNSLVDPKNLQYVPDARGMAQARQAVGAHLNFDWRRVLLTASTSESYSFLFRLLLNPGDKVLVPKPSYPLFQFLLELNDAAFAYYPLIYVQGRWQIDFTALEGLIDANTKAIVLVNPNNPTGSYVKTEELRQLNALCRKHQLAIISDEVFFDYRLSEGPFVSLQDNAEVLTFALGGLSKGLGMPQMKLGWMLASGPQAVVQDALSRLEIIADTFLSVNTPVQNACGAWLSLAPAIRGQILERVKSNLAFLKNLPLNIFHTEGGWYAVVPLGPRDEEEFVYGLLKEDHVLAHPGYFFDLEPGNHLVLSLIVPEHVFQKGVAKMIQRAQS